LFIRINLFFRMKTSILNFIFLVLFALPCLANAQQKEQDSTKTPKAVIKKRLKIKRKTSEKKANRKPPDVE
ncbi:MAG: hypothetical protein ABIO60_08955, partial [Aquaticitalea sp.]